jgi:regulator of replication initiation timing
MSDDNLKKITPEDEALELKTKIAKLNKTISALKKAILKLEAENLSLEQENSLYRVYGGD